MAQYLNGLYWALVEGRFLFDFVHEGKMTADGLLTYAAVLLPNVAWLSDAQCGVLREYVARGGSLLGTFQTGLFDERGAARTDYGLADVFGIRRAGDLVGTTGNGYMGRIEGTRPILEGFAPTPPIREFYPIGPLTVRMPLPAGTRPSMVSLLQAGTDVPFEAATGAVTFTIPRVVDYEVAAIS